MFHIFLQTGKAVFFICSSFVYFNVFSLAVVLWALRATSIHHISDRLNYEWDEQEYHFLYLLKWKLAQTDSSNLAFGIWCKSKPRSEVIQTSDFKVSSVSLAMWDSTTTSNSDSRHCSREQSSLKWVWKNLVW